MLHSRLLVALLHREQRLKVVLKEHVRAVQHVNVVTRWTSTSLCHGMVCVIVHAVLIVDPVCQCSAAAKLAKKLNVDCPIIDGIFRVIHEKAEPLRVSSLPVCRTASICQERYVAGGSLYPPPPLPPFPLRDLP